jgi:hypothetical protein
MRKLAARPSQEFATPTKKWPDLRGQPKNAGTAPLADNQPDQIERIARTARTIQIGKHAPMNPAIR